MSKQFYKIYLFVFCSLLLIVSCTKETSFESGSLFGSAEGTLKDTAGNCQGISIKGQYVMDSVLTDSNYVTITATITKSGNYKIYTSAGILEDIEYQDFILPPATLFSFRRAKNITKKSF